MRNIGAPDTKAMLHIKDVICKNIQDQVKLAENSDHLVFRYEAKELAVA